ncbi:MAG: iron complex outerrane recepter protein [Sphingomonadales bacterium]|jgi:iron complex outermembrane receptor protein|nr:iron complex outerrane recepter protein [Sphingomonadales bacterium]
MKKIALLCASTAFVMPSMAWAQSTGSIAVEEEAIVVTGTRNADVNGVTVPNTAKTQAVLNQEFIGRQSPGQSILNTVNLVPGVNFTSSDAYGSSGGNIRIRGFDGNRISLTFDGVPLNDSGNYAIFSNQQLDPELIEQVNVNLGQTDVDSPTASASGGTVNYRTRLPSRDLGFRLSGSIGEDDYRRGFAMIDTGEFWDGGPRAFLSYSNTRYDWFRGPGEIYKQQFNARIYYSLGSNGDFISVAGHYNRNRNNFSRNPSFNDLRTTVLPSGQAGILGATVVAPASTVTPSKIGEYDDQQWAAIFAFNNFATCTLATQPSNAGVIENDNGGPLPNGTGAQLTGGTNNIANTSSCTNFTGLRINPSNTGNIRINGRFHLADNIILTIDPSYQYVLANGGGTTVLAENNFRTRGGAPASAGVDYNGDGDFLDNVRFYTPNNTNTNRLGLTSSLIWDITPQHRFRVAYTFDRAHHRQTGEWGYLQADGNPESPFSGRNARPVLDATGFQIQQRDRTSIAMLNQFAAQYIGHFADDRLRVELGLRMPFFKRELETFCPIQAADGFAYCTSEVIRPRGTVVVVPPGTPAGSIPIFINQGDPLPANAAFRPLYAPFAANYSFNPILPNAGIVYNFGGGFSAFASYARGFSSPRTDNLYRAPLVTVDPETTNAFDLGVRYIRRNFQAQATLWKIDYKNRIVTSFNVQEGISVDRNVGSVNTWGFDGSIAWQPIPEISLLALASYNHSRLQQNINLSAGAAVDCNNATDVAPIAGCAVTAGKRVAETPDWQFGGRVQLYLGPVTIGAQAKWVDERFATDDNSILTDDYTTVDVDARLDLGPVGLPDSYVQMNVTNLFNERYFGNISTQINAAANPNFSIGAPQTFMVTLNLAWHAGQ